MNATAGSDERSTGGKAQLEREGDEIREDIDRTLDALERKFSPDQLVERSVGFLRENGMNLVEEIGATVRSHPVPILLTAAGLIWLTGSVASSRSSGGRNKGIRSSDMRPQSSSGRQDGSRYASSGSPAQARSAANSVRSQISNSAETLRAHTRDVSENLSTLVREQPLALGALAVATGALIGAALPMTRYENEFLGEANERTMAKVREAGQEQYERVRESVTEAFESNDVSKGAGRAPSPASQPQA